jgi:hypothetical protein
LPGKGLKNFFFLFFFLYVHTGTIILCRGPTSCRRGTVRVEWTCLLQSADLLWCWQRRKIDHRVHNVNPHCYENNKFLWKLFFIWECDLIHYTIRIRIIWVSVTV